MIYFISSQIRLFSSTDIQLATSADLLEWIKDKDTLELDSETTGFDPHTCKVLTWQIGNEIDQWVIDVSGYERGVMPYWLADIFESDRLFLLANAKFDLRFALSCGVDIKRVYDVFLAECLLTAGLRETEEQKAKYRLGLDHLAEKYANIVLDKSIRGNIHKEGLTDRVIKYAADDVKALGIIKTKQEEALKSWGLMRVMQLENEVVRVFARMEQLGVHLDTTKWLAVAEVTEANTIALEKELDNIVKDEKRLSDYIPKYVQSSLFDTAPPSARPSIKWSSPVQKLKLLQVLVPKLTGTGDRELQREKKSHPLVPKLIDYAKQSKLASAFGKDFLKYVNKSTGLIHPSYWQILSTGRISSSDPNVNQIPSKGELAKAIRAAFTAPSGRKIVGGDYSGMELRIIAELSQDPVWLDAFNTGKDLHSVLCALTFDIDISEVKSECPFKPGWSYRDVQKTINFGLALIASAAVS